MKSELAIGVILGIAGTAVLWNGINTRYAMNSNSVEISESSILPIPQEVDEYESKPENTFQSQQTPRVQPKLQSLEKTVKLQIPETVKDFKYSKYKQLLLKKLNDLDWSKEDKDRLKRYLADPRARFRPNVLLVNSSHQETSAQYKQYTAPVSIGRSFEFLYKNLELLSEAVNDETVPLEIITAILRIESDFGRYPGKESVFNVFWSLSLGDHPQVQKEIVNVDDPEKAEKIKKLKKRAKWGRKQLRDLIYMTHAGGGDDPLAIMGSWAGAFGLPQFIPTSYRAYGRDGNSDGVIDLNNIEDAAASISFYLKSNGWKKKSSRKKHHKTIMRYNISEHYADCVLSLADSLRERLDGLQ